MDSSMDAGLQQMALGRQQHFLQQRGYQGSLARICSVLAAADSDCLDSACTDVRAAPYLKSGLEIGLPVLQLASSCCQYLLLVQHLLYSIADSVPASTR